MVTPAIPPTLTDPRGPREGAEFPNRPSSLAPVRFGIFYEHQLPRPWGDDGEHRLLHDALEQIEIADRVGFDTVSATRAGCW